MAGDGRAAQPRRLADGGGQAAGDRRLPPRADAGGQACRGGARARGGGAGQIEAIEAALDDEIGDELLGLVFTACHPILGREARAALTLRLVGGLTAEEIARAFLSSEPTVAQRIVRAKKTLRAAGPDFAVPRGAEREARVASVLEVVYLMFNEGYAATAGEDLIRPRSAPRRSGWGGSSRG